MALPESDYHCCRVEAPSIDGRRVAEGLAELLRTPDEGFLVERNDESSWSALGVRHDIRTLKGELLLALYAGRGPVYRAIHRKEYACVSIHAAIRCHAENAAADIADSRLREVARRSMIGNGLGPVSPVPPPKRFRRSLQEGLAALGANPYLP